MRRRMPAAALLLSGVSGCAAMPAAPDACEVWEPPLRLSEAAVAAMDAEDLRQLDLYYGTGERICGWTP